MLLESRRGRRRGLFFWEKVGRSEELHDSGKEVEGLCTFLSSMPPPYLHTFLSISRGWVSLWSWTILRHLCQGNDQRQGKGVAKQQWALRIPFRWLNLFLENSLPFKLGSSVLLWLLIQNWSCESCLIGPAITHKLFLVFQVSFIVTHQFLSFSKVIMHLCIPSAWQTWPARTVSAQKIMSSEWMRGRCEWMIFPPWSGAWASIY